MEAKKQNQKPVFLFFLVILFRPVFDFEVAKRAKGNTNYLLPPKQNWAKKIPNVAIQR